MFTLTPYDYTLEWLDARTRLHCVFAIASNDRKNMGEKEIVLGSAFPRKYYTVFDWELQRIGCMYYLSHTSVDCQFDH
jgi:hypothetical protein